MKKGSWTNLTTYDEMYLCLEHLTWYLINLKQIEPPVPVVEDRFLSIIEFVSYYSNINK